MAETQPGRLVGGRFRLTDPLGSGGFGRVWRARDETLQVDVAVKEVWLPPAASPEEHTERLARAQREGRNAAVLRGHPNIVAVHDVVIEDDAPWIVMELVQGSSLAQYLRAHGALTVDVARHVAGGLLAALGAAHAAGIVHRDVKPANVMLTADGRVLLTDFGIAVRTADTSLTALGGLVGSMEYMPPERFNGGAASGAGDLYSLGVTLYQATEDISPFHRDTPTGTLTAIVLGPSPVPERAGPLTPLITALMHKDPGQRPGVEQALALLAGVAPAPSSGPAPTRALPTVRADIPLPFSGPPAQDVREPAGALPQQAEGSARPTQAEAWQQGAPQPGGWQQPGPPQPDGWQQPGPPPAGGWQAGQQQPEGWQPGQPQVDGWQSGPPQPDGWQQGPPQPDGWQMPPEGWQQPAQPQAAGWQPPAEGWQQPGPQPDQGWQQPVPPPAKPQNTRTIVIAAVAGALGLVVVCAIMVGVGVLGRFGTDGSRTREPVAESTGSRYTPPAAETTEPAPVRTTAAPTKKAFDPASLDGQSTDNTPLTAAALLPDSFTDAKGVVYNRKGSGTEGCNTNYKQSHVNDALSAAHCQAVMGGTYVDNSEQILVAVWVVPLADTETAQSAYASLKDVHTGDWGILCPASGAGADVCHKDIGSARKAGYTHQHHRYLTSTVAIYINLTESTTADTWLDAAAKKAAEEAGPLNYSGNR
ncbi:hypothetical protein Lfu02_62440 [Longispora fulva]|uniref:non-specific serine/threonine protein kinase n=1 Tax=Longispora fulva TaxID=619741 RepID=A0A8J7GAB4_9ACTN|nr:serine/threonine-protein kinase [Longispora fulva]MBG6134664.1 hypothetical protein [Longispora fulva]GIG61872.1 hypothetical protein Lfu02_62440 [Longispora fulva]